jgi:hypothetical protein
MKTMMMDAETVGLIERAMLSHGLFRRYPRQRFTAAEEFASHGYTVEDMNRLASAVHSQKPRNMSAALASWLKDADEQLHNRVLTLRSEARHNMQSQERRLGDLSQEDRRISAMRGIGGLLSDDWTLKGAISRMNDEFQLATPITEDEAKASDLVHFRLPSEEATKAIDAMLERIRIRHQREDV